MCVCCDNVRVRGLRQCWYGVRRDVGAVSVCRSGTRSSGVLSSTGDVLEMSVVRGVGGVCGMCLARGGVGGEVVSG